MRILITGGAGCLGSNLIEHWHPRGHEILVLDNFGDRQAGGGTAGQTAHARGGHDRRPGAGPRTVHAFKPACGCFLQGPWQLARGRGHEHHRYDQPVGCAEAGVTRLVNLQTCCAMAVPRRVPIPVDHALRPFTEAYGFPKVAGEQYIALSGLRWASLRLANGPRLAIGPIPTFYKRLKAGQGCFCTDARRDFLDMSDFVAAIDRFMGDDPPTGAFNIASGQGHAIREIYDLVRAHLGLPADPSVKVVPVGDDDVPVVVTPRERRKHWVGARASTSRKRYGGCWIGTTPMALVTCTATCRRPPYR